MVGRLGWVKYGEFCLNCFICDRSIGFAIWTLAKLCCVSVTFFFYFSFLFPSCLESLMIESRVPYSIYLQQYALQSMLYIGGIYSIYILFMLCIRMQALLFIVESNHIKIYRDRTFYGVLAPDKLHTWWCCCTYL